MKLLHTSDLHIGKRVNGFSMLPDQEYILAQILAVVKREQPDAVLIAGDVYDKTQPSAEAVGVLDEFLTQLVEEVSAIFVISGNHDSPERLDFGSRIMREKGLYIAGVYDGQLQRVQLYDEYGAIHFYLLPFIKPAMITPYFERVIDSYEAAVQAAIEGVAEVREAGIMEDGRTATGGLQTRGAAIDERQRNVLLSHQFVTAGAARPQRCDSEAISIGGLDNVDASIFSAFDYVALGHIHGPQRIGRDTVRYAGSPLKYSFSEIRQKKSVTIVDLGRKGEVSQRQIPLIPLREMRSIKGPIEELIEAASEDEPAELSVTTEGEQEAQGEKPLEGKRKKSRDDYISAVITDEEEPYDAIGRLRAVYPNLMCLNFDSGDDRNIGLAGELEEGGMGQKNPLELFAAFYEGQNGEGLNEVQLAFLQKIVEGSAEKDGMGGERK